MMRYYLLNMLTVSLAMASVQPAATHYSCFNYRGGSDIDHWKTVHRYLVGTKPAVYTCSLSLVDQ